MMQVFSRPDDRSEVMIVSLSGDLDLSSVSSLRSVTMKLVEDGWSRVVLDFQDVGFLDSAGIGVLIGVRRRCLAAGGSCVLSSVPDDVSRTLVAAEVDRLFETFDDVEAARRSVLRAST
jgi:anti-anti-sigma factor